MLYSLCVGKHSVKHSKVISQPTQQRVSFVENMKSLVQYRM